jgi:hypothetical protein
MGRAAVMGWVRDQEAVIAARKEAEVRQEAAAE